MASDIDAVLARANAVFAAHDGFAGAARAGAAKAGRAAGELARRAVRAAGVAGAAGLGAIGYGVAVAPIGIEGLLIGVPLAGAAALGAALLPVRRRAAAPTPKFAELPAARLGPVAREWLELKRAAFPRTAAPATQRILSRLGGLGPLWAVLPDTDPALADARRLLSDHLPRLVDAWQAVPAAARVENASVNAGLTDGLAVIADELDRLWAAQTADKVRDVAAEGRFLETRYGGF